MTGTHTPRPWLGLGLAVRLVLELTVLELTVLVGAGVLAWRIAAPWRWGAVVAAPIGIAAVWGLILSPKATTRLPAGTRPTIEAVIFLGVRTGLVMVGHPVVALVGVAAWMADRVALSVLG